MNKDLRNTLIAIVVAVLIAGGIIYMVVDTQASLDLVNQENAALEEAIAANEKEIARIPVLTQTLTELQNNFRDYVKILPSAEVATPEKLIRVIQGYLEASQVKLEDILTRKIATQTSAKGGEFEEVAVTVKISSEFDTFIKFLNLLERHEQFLKVNSFAITPSSKEGQASNMAVNIEISTYRYIPKKQ